MFALHFKIKHINDTPQSIKKTFTFYDLENYAKIMTYRNNFLITIMTHKRVELSFSDFRSS